MGRGGACVPARIALRGRIHRSSPCTMRVFLVWKRRYANVRAGTQAPPLRVSFGWIARRRLMSFGWIAWNGWFRLGKIVRGCITEMVGKNHRGGRVGACAYSTKPMALAFFMSKAMSGSRSLGTLLSSTASFKVCFNWPTSRHGPR